MTAVSKKPQPSSKPKAITAEPAKARVHIRVTEEAKTPAPSPRQTELKFTKSDIEICRQSTPPAKKHTVIIGSTASHNVNERSPWAKPFAYTTSAALNGVRNSSGKVPSLRSRLMQSAVNKGTRIQIEKNSAWWNRLKRRAPAPAPPPS